MLCQSPNRTPHTSTTPHDLQSDTKIDAKDMRYMQL